MPQVLNIPWFWIYVWFWMRTSRIRNLSTRFLVHIITCLCAQLRISDFVHLKQLFVHACMLTCTSLCIYYKDRHAFYLQFTIKVSQIYFLILVNEVIFYEEVNEVIFVHVFLCILLVSKVHGSCTLTSLYLIFEALWICQVSEYVRFTQGFNYARIIPERDWICLNMAKYMWMC